MNAQILLETVRGEGLEVKAIRTAIERLRADALSVGGKGLGAERGRDSNKPHSAPFEEPAISAVDLLNKYNDKLNQHAQRVDLVQTYIDLMDKPTERAVLIERYISCLEWQAIIESLDKPESTVYSIHRRAINSLQAVIDRGKD